MSNVFLLTSIPIKYIKDMVSSCFRLCAGGSPSYRSSGRMKRWAGDLDDGGCPTALRSVARPHPSPTTFPTHNCEEPTLSATKQSITCALFWKVRLRIYGFRWIASSPPKEKEGGSSQ